MMNKRTVFHLNDSILDPVAMAIGTPASYFHQSRPINTSSPNEILTRPLTSLIAPFIGSTFLNLSSEISCRAAMNSGTEILDSIPG